MLRIATLTSVLALTASAALAAEIKVGVSPVSTLKSWNWLLRSLSRWGWKSTLWNFPTT